MSKAAITDLIAKLRDAAKMQDPIASAAIELVHRMGEAAKENLVSADGDDMLRAQGSARMLSKLHTDLTTRPPNISETNR